MKIEFHGVKITSVLAMLIATYTGAAHAGVPSGIVTATANVTFANPTSVSLNITPIAGLMAGDYNSNRAVAKAEVDVTNPSKIAYRWTPGSGVISPSLMGGADTEIVIKGNNSPDKDTIELSALPVNDAFYDGGSGWILPMSQVKSSFPLKVVTGKNEKINADTYVLSLDAAVWNS